MKMTCSGWKIKENCHAGNFPSKTIGCREIKFVLRDVKWCFNASWGLKGLRGGYCIVNKHVSSAEWWTSALDAGLIFNQYWLTQRDHPIHTTSLCMHAAFTKYVCVLVQCLSHMPSLSDAGSLLGQRWWGWPSVDSATALSRIKQDMNTQWYPRCVRVCQQSVWLCNSDVDPMLGSCWANVEDGGPTLTQHWFQFSCLLEILY